MSARTATTPQLPWSLFTARPTDPNAFAPDAPLDPELEALVESLTKRIAAPLPSLSFAPLPVTPRIGTSPTFKPNGAPMPMLSPTTKASPSPLSPLATKPLEPRRKTKEEPPQPEERSVPPTPEIMAPTPPLPPKDTAVLASPYARASAPAQTPAGTTVSPSTATHTIHVDTPRSKDVIALLSFLDAVDADMAVECQRVRDNIAEVRTLASKCQSEREARIAAFKSRRERERRETKEIGHDFWAGV